MHTCSTIWKLLLLLGRLMCFVISQFLPFYQPFFYHFYSQRSINLSCKSEVTVVYFRWPTCLWYLKVSKGQDPWQIILDCTCKMKRSDTYFQEGTSGKKVFKHQITMLWPLTCLMMYVMKIVMGLANLAHYLRQIHNIINSHNSPVLCNMSKLKTQYVTVSCLFILLDNLLRIHHVCSYVETSVCHHGHVDDTNYCRCSK